MKIIIIILVVFLFNLSSLLAQAPEKMSYQAVIRNSSNELVVNTQIGMQISILQGSVNGILVYTEIQTPTTNSNGLVSIEIGESTGFDTIDWSNGPYFIKTETDPTGGINYTITGNSELLSVPYALYAKTAENISGTITETDPIFVTSVANGINTTDTTNWNNKLSIEVDGSITNEIQILSISNDTIYLTNGGFAKLPATNAWSLTGNTGTTPTTNFIGTTDSQDLIFRTNNADRIHIYSDGDMRFGSNINAGATYPMEIQIPSTTGSQFVLKLTNLLSPAYNSGSGVGLLFAPDDAAIAKMGIMVERKGPWGVGTMHFLSRTSGDYASADLSNSVMALTQNGYFGIGTTNPTSYLHINSTSTADDLTLGKFFSALDQNGEDNNIMIGKALSTGNSAVFGYIYNTNTNNSGAYITVWGDTPGTTGLFVQKGGNVGIGTTAPTVKLQVVGNSKFGTTSMINIWEWDGVEKIGLDYNTTNGDFNMRNPVAGKRLLGTISSTGSWGIETTAGIEMLRLTGSGNLGIGTTIPNAKLDLGLGYGASGEKFLIYNDNTSGPLVGTKTGFYLDRFSLQNNVTFVFPTAPAFPGSYIIARKNTASTTLEALMTILGETGNVGIGTTTPSTKLDVNGTITANGGNSTNWNEAYSWGNHALAGYLTAEIDNSITNEIQTLSISNDTIYLSNGGFVKIPEQKSVPALISQDDFSCTALKNYWSSSVAGTASISLSNAQVVLSTASSSGVAKLYSNKQKSVTEGKLIFTAVLYTYEDNNTAYGPLTRGLVNGIDRNNAIEFINISGNTIQTRTVSGGVATTTNYAVGTSVANYYSYTIIATSTKVEFYFDGVLIATHTTNIPTLPLNMYFDASTWSGNVPQSIDDAKFEIIN
jgi:hypothetical protein